MIINLRGTHGSGKSHIVRELIRMGGSSYEFTVNKGEAVTVTLFDGVPLFAIGSYSEKRVAVGCDNIRTQDAVCSLVRHFSQFGHVIFEGIIPSHIFGRYAELAQELTRYGEGYVWVFMGTKLSVCYDRVVARRQRMGVTKPLSTAMMVKMHKDCYRTYKNVIRYNQEHDVPLDYIVAMPDTAVDQVVDLLRSNISYTTYKENMQHG